MANIRHHRALWRNPHTWYITTIMLVCSIFYYLDTIIELIGWSKLQWDILYEPHDLHRLLFLIPVLYAAYIFRVRGVIVTALISMLIFLPRAMFISPYPGALLRPITFMVIIGMVGILLSKLLNNITERKRLEEKIQQQNEFLNSILDSLAYPFYVVDANDYTIKMANPAAKLGNLSENPTCYSLTHKSDKPCRGVEHVCPLEEVKKTKKPVVVEHTHYDEDGNVRNIEVHGYPIFDTKGNVIQMIEYYFDITERKQAEEALRESKELFKKIFISQRAAIFILDAKTPPTILDCNPAATEVFGYTRQEILGATTACLHVDEAALQKFQERLYPAIAQRGFLHLPEFTMRRKDRTVFYTEHNVMPLKDEEGNRIGWVSVVRDITERKQAEEALRESEQFSSSLLIDSPNPILVINPDTSIRYVNPALEKLTGFASAELIGRKAPYPWWTEETLQKTTTDLREGMRRGIARVEELFQRKDGERFWVEITSLPIMHIGALKNYVSNWVDITERKQAEEREKELQQELALSSRLAAIGELAAGVAHEINNPLTGVIGFSQRLLRKSTDEKVSQDLERIHNEAQRAAKVVENLLTFARRREPEKQYSDTNDIVQKALELRAYQLKTSNIELVTDLAPGLPQIMVDFGQIQEVFVNIILNAEQAMTEANRGGKLTIKTQEVKGYIRVSFTDDGPGIATEHLDKLFDPFFTTKEGGTGLGLSICHGIVSEHGGRIYARSKPGKGATFVVELPMTTVQILTTVL